MITQEIKFVGFPSNDGDTYCWDVSREEFIRLSGREPEQRETSWYREGYYRFYTPNVYPYPLEPIPITMTWTKDGDKYENGVVEVNIAYGDKVNADSTPVEQFDTKKLFTDPL